MSELYILRALLEINGKSITDFKSVTEGEVARYKTVNLMNTTGHAAIMPRYTVKTDYVVPFDTPEFDFSQVQGGTLTLDYQNGTRKKYGGVYVTKEGEAKFDGDNEVVKTIEFSAKTKK
jgi:hypothetical protein